MTTKLSTSRNIDRRTSTCVSRTDSYRTGRSACSYNCATADALGVIDDIYGVSVLVSLILCASVICARQDRKTYCAMSSLRFQHRSGVDCIVHQPRS